MQWLSFERFADARAAGWMRPSELGRIDLGHGYDLRPMWDNGKCVMGLHLTGSFQRRGDYITHRYLEHAAISDAARWPRSISARFSLELNQINEPGCYAEVISVDELRTAVGAIRAEISRQVLELARGALPGVEQ